MLCRGATARRAIVFRFQEQGVKRPLHKAVLHHFGRLVPATGEPYFLPSAVPCAFWAGHGSGVRLPECHLQVSGCRMLSSTTAPSTMPAPISTPCQPRSRR